MTRKKDNRTIDEFWEYRLTPCKTDCKDYAPYQSGAITTEGSINSWTWQYKPIVIHKTKEDEYEDEDTGPRIWRDI